VANRLVRAGLRAFSPLLDALVGPYREQSRTEEDGRRRAATPTAGESDRIGVDQPESGRLAVASNVAPICASAASPASMWRFHAGHGAVSVPGSEAACRLRHQLRVAELPAIPTAGRHRASRSAATADRRYSQRSRGCPTQCSPRRRTLFRRRAPGFFAAGPAGAVVFTVRCGPRQLRPLSEPPGSCHHARPQQTSRHRTEPRGPLHPPLHGRQHHPAGQQDGHNSHTPMPEHVAPVPNRGSDHADTNAGLNRRHEGNGRGQTR
jgi:hypothetical protein